MLEGTVLLTGGSGFLGRALLRRAHREGWPARFIIYSRDEMKQWEVKQRYPNVQCVLGDVSRNFDRLVSIMTGCDTVIHMGAVKFIPEAEQNVLETIEVNIDGSRNVGLAAIAAGVDTVVGISTDKASAPVNLYGMTKAVMERMYGEFDSYPGANFVTARYGNVIGSTGSVIPVFKRQIQEDGELRVTHEDMTRFWFSVDEAIDLILWAYEDAEEYSGHTFISACPAMQIADIARAVWQMNLPGEPNIKYTGLRPGEKIHEDLFNLQEAPRVKAMGDQGFIMVPAREIQTNNHVSCGYNSGAPNRWMGIEEMMKAIEDAETV